MIRRVNIVGAQWHEYAAGQWPHEWCPPQCKRYDPMKHDDRAALIYTNSQTYDVHWLI